MKRRSIAQQEEEGGEGKEGVEGGRGGREVMIQPAMWHK